MTGHESSHVTGPSEDVRESVGRSAKAFEISLFRWQHCAISQEPLRKPVVACELGKMYNKVGLGLNRKMER